MTTLALDFVDYRHRVVEGLRADGYAASSAIALARLHHGTISDGYVMCKPAAEIVKFIVDSEENDDAPVVDHDRTPLETVSRVTVVDYEFDDQERAG